MTDEIEWRWWAGRDDERFTLGPFDTRTNAIQAGRDDFDSDGFYIVEAQQARPIDLANYCHPYRLIEDMAETIDEECGDPDDYGSLAEDAWTSEQEKDLDAMLKETVRAWQAKHNLQINSWQFQHTRNGEWIEPLPNEDEAA